MVTDEEARSSMKEHFLRTITKLNGKVNIIVFKYLLLL